MSDPIVGIDLGTSNTVVAHADATDTAHVLADASGIKIHPSVVSFHPNGGVVVGAPAKQRKVIDPKNTIYSAKRLIGRTYGSKEVQTAKQRVPYQIKEGANQLPLIVTRGGEFAVPEISAILLDHAKVVAGTALETEVSRAVVTVPASFNDAQRSATATAGSIAGIHVVRVLNEPTAAALAYGHARNLRETIAVYDFGGGTFDVTILKLEDDVYEVLGTSGDSFLGGDDLDERLVDRMVEKFLVEKQVDLRMNELSMMRLRAVAEQTKIELSRRSRAVVRIDEIAYGANGKALDLVIEISRDELVEQVADIVDKTFPVCEESLKLAGLTIDHIDDIILVGGTTKIPYVRDQVAKFFAKTPRTDVNPEDAVAIGAALQATALERILKRKSPSRPHTPLSSFDDSEVSFGGESSTATGGDTETFTEVTGGITETRLRPTERPVTRGEHTDIFEERPPPNTAQVLARITKPGVQAPAAPSKTSLGLAIPPLPTAIPQPKTTSPRAVVQRPPAVPNTEISTVVVAPSASDSGLDAPSTTPPIRPAAAPPPRPKTAPVILDVTPRGLGIGTVAGFCEELIRRNSRVPTEMKRLFTTSRDDQDAVRIIVVQGESRRMDNNTVIADLRLENLAPRPRGETSIEVTFHIDANGILQVHARDAQTGREQRASLDIVGSIAHGDVSSSREKLQALRR